MNVTFVTALIDVHDEVNLIRMSLEQRIGFFNRLNNTGVRLHVFVSPEHRDKINVTNGVIETISLEDLHTYAISPGGLPDIRLEGKDTRNFLIMINSKIELVNRAIESGKHQSTHYAWIDFNIYHVLRDPAADQKLKSIADSHFPAKCLYSPGCWDKCVTWDSVNWRFCGGFLLGDIASLQEMYQLQLSEYPKFPKLTWEVNTWAYLESIGLHIDWYAADHNDTIIDVPMNFIVIPSGIQFAWSSPNFCLRIGGPMYNYVLKCIQSHPLTAIFPLSDGVIGDEEFDRMIASLGREDTVTMPARVYNFLEQMAPNPLMCMHAARDFTSDSLLLMPGDDVTFDHGISIPQINWNDKLSIAVWRGGSSGFYRPSIRMQVVDHLFNVPNTDVKFVRGGWPVNDNIIPDHHFGERIPMEQHVNFKYILVIDGNTLASNGQWTFATGSVPIIITHPKNRWWMQDQLEPMVNYVPVKYDLSDLVDKIEWLINHDDEAQTIATNALSLSRRVLTPDFQRKYIKNRIDALI